MTLAFLSDAGSGTAPVISLLIAVGAILLLGLMWSVILRGVNIKERVSAGTVYSYIQPWSQLCMTVILHWSING